MSSKAFNHFLNLQTTAGRLFTDFGYDSLLQIVGHTLYLIKRKKLTEMFLSFLILFWIIKS